ncbi:phosphonate metabolism protein/1,5-bisphosphokinase (PRPP-forming) PhnN [Roseovarius salinarum]|uniref:phosphonate metabolism protein/1,5-bisphosphokinase (PRPP-forming) PhnN n=1 Tax=Roseovarius salinarum TaxID=1981892 RepID=UPI000C3277E7|nr:phosphonate metabolism protein/1,5-bisphosphokinase (PRPP-forming) PhnN [Roseovarius salinarum]
MSAGRLIGVVGPSGVGKDTVMTALVEACPRLEIAPRVITRPADAGGEAFEGVSEAEFLARRASGAFLLNWQAHGLRYGVPVTVLDRLAAGRDVLVNLSRCVLPDAAERAEAFVVLSLTAPPKALARRLAARGRESEADVAARLARADMMLPDVPAPVIEVSNDGPVSETVAEVLARLYPAETPEKA